MVMSAALAVTQDERLSIEAEADCSIDEDPAAGPFYRPRTI
jgi:hypothetical protein